MIKSTPSSRQTDNQRITATLNAYAQRASASTPGQKTYGLYLALLTALILGGQIADEPTQVLVGNEDW